MAEYKPYPKWLHFEGEPSVLVQDQAEHEAVIVARHIEPEPPAAATPQAFSAFDPDHDGRPGGAPKGGNRKPKAAA